MLQNTNEMQFHISPNQYTHQEKITIKDKTDYYKSKELINQNWVDDFLNCNKPKGFPDRKKAVYAFSSLEYCERLMGNEKKFSQGKYFYRVQMKEPIQVPMCLVYILLKQGEIGNKNLSITQEYWQPKLVWRCLEYMSEEMIILEKVNAPIDNILLRKAYNDYLLDIEQANKFVSKLMC
jgi:hypothetical protein